MSDTTLQNNVPNQGCADTGRVDQRIGLCRVELKYLKCISFSLSVELS